MMLVVFGQTSQVGPVLLSDRNFGQLGRRSGAHGPLFSSARTSVCVASCRAIMRLHHPG
ncbi:hypothetical protein GLOTRDRAFT_110692 [Gloeophyllum trabeum ATCC 11539]|uniref:Uncharacterized protein n=1 Tax=Gloeophyllum trabeum (strain ATCC 11539 / FP-39264 / Madison 617) TaxID=670483 RepID=S7Q9I6_GLOTA|nr:uncharacterized protein GLOTRDRAFT_110692 [Gloeophyllum trabeum ATCC 11539]EPQ56182.1 hypothetical protein GLOTRDRAFT_110692 [Gloeophyllum trabeum ATCC 11539]